MGEDKETKCRRMEKEMGMELGMEEGGGGRKRSLWQDTQTWGLTGLEERRYVAGVLRRLLRSFPGAHGCHNPPNVELSIHRVDPPKNREKDGTRSLLSRLKRHWRHTDGYGDLKTLAMPSVDLHLGTDPAIPSQRHQGFASPSPHPFLFLSFYLLFLFYFIIFCPMQVSFRPFAPLGLQQPSAGA
ncbi:hypothetical protein D9C73_022653 [Collichthys lucidus]|uniref:Uncharacterized protein n=1 Tax=Collichthys lucidus TaxID=240159 RepID=A0A4U5VKU5_COLLU|nr:hypothetical protein D9C73_022653 [Collichthys lucidus]